MIRTRRCLFTLLALAAAVALPTLSAAAPPAPDQGEPFQRSFSLQGTSGSVCTPFIVPQGQRLLVQDVSGGMVVPGGKNISVTVSGALDADVYSRRTVALNLRREVLNPSNQDRLKFAQPMRLFVGEGQTLNMCAQIIPFTEPDFLVFDGFDVTGVLTKNP